MSHLWQKMADGGLQQWPMKTDFGKKKLFFKKKKLIFH